MVTAACVTSVAISNSKVHGANMGPIWGRQDPGGAHVDPMNLATWDVISNHGIEYIRQRCPCFYTPATKLGGVYWIQPVCLSVRLSVCLSVR